MNETELKKLYWHSRRGMLELDLILIPFAQDRLQHLDSDIQQLYQQLLAEEDQDLFVWLLRKETAPEANLQKIIDIILEK